MVEKHRIFLILNNFPINGTMVAVHIITRPQMMVAVLGEIDKDDCSNTASL